MVSNRNADTTLRNLRLTFYKFAEKSTLCPLLRDTYRFRSGRSSLWTVHWRRIGLPVDAEHRSATLPGHARHQPRHQQRRSGKQEIVVRAERRPAGVALNRSTDDTSCLALWNAVALVRRLLWKNKSKQMQTASRVIRRLIGYWVTALRDGAAGAHDTIFMHGRPDSGGRAR